jgi:hypothetical protein
MSIRSKSPIYNLDVYNTIAFSCITIGLPFATFKFIFGTLLLRLAEGPLSNYFVIIGYTICLWGIIDFIFNTLDAIFCLMKKKIIAPCILAQVGRIFKYEKICLAIDTLASFSIICTTLWTGYIAKLSYVEIKLWNIATTVNLISLSSIMIWNEYNILTKAQKNTKNSTDVVEPHLKNHYDK